MLYYVAPLESRYYIEKNGILTPKEVRILIDRGELEENVLGVSFGGIDSSNFPDYVSLLEDFLMTRAVAEQISYSRNQRYNNFMAIGFVIDDVIRTHEEYVDNDIVMRMNPDSYQSEVLYKGNIPKRFVGRCFGVRV